MCDSNRFNISGVSQLACYAEKLEPRKKLCFDPTP